MKGWWSWLLVAALLAAPALAEDKKKEDKKAKEAPAAQAPVPQPLAVQPSAQDIVKEAQAKLAAGDADRAFAMLEKAARVDGKVGLSLGMLRESRGELLPAEDAYRAAAEKLSGAEKGEALGRLAVVQDAQGVPEAAASAAAAIAADPEGLWPTIAMSYRRAHEGKPDEGVALAQKAVAAGGGAAAKAALGHALDAEGDTAGAEAAYREAIAADPVALIPVVGLAHVLRVTGRAAEAEPMLKKAIDASPGSAEAYKEMARVKVALGRAQEGLADANLAVAMTEDDPEATSLVMEVKVARALEDLAAGRNELAIKDLNQLRDENPDSPAVWLGLGRAHLAKREADAAVAELQKAVELDPKNAEAQYDLGFALHVLKRDPARAVAPLEKAAAGQPGNPTYATALGLALTDAQQFDRAADVLTRATEMPSYQDPNGYAALGQACVNLKRYQEAVPALEKATTLAPKNAQAWATLGWAYFGLKDKENFKAAGAKARSLGYNEPTFLAYLQRIEAGEAIK
jgi:tetratricopeptide (TPR) repeat protein